MKKLTKGEESLIKYIVKDFDHRFEFVNKQVYLVKPNVYTVLMEFYDHETQVHFDIDFRKFNNRAKIVQFFMNYEYERGIETGKNNKISEIQNVLNITGWMQH